jgi:hypothetical protein
MAQSQQEIFEQAKQSIASELDEEILAWDFSIMLSQLRAVIAKRNESTRHNGIRFFCRHYLGMHGNSFKEMRHWLSEEAVMPFGKIQLVLRTLKSERDGKLVPEPPNKGGNKKTQGSGPRPPRGLEKSRRCDDSPWLAPMRSKTFGIIRKLIDHMTTIFNSSMILVVEANVPSKKFAMHSASKSFSPNRKRLTTNR